MLTDMWSGRTDIVSPNKFKSTVAKSAPRFVGYRYLGDLGKGRSGAGTDWGGGVGIVGEARGEVLGEAR